MSIEKVGGVWVAAHYIPLALLSSTISICSSTSSRIFTISSLSPISSRYNLVRCGAMVVNLGVTRKCNKKRLLPGCGDEISLNPAGFQCLPFNFR